MRLHRFYSEEKIGNREDFVFKGKSIIEQIRRVFRLKTGDSVIIFDGSGTDYICKIKSFDKDSMVLFVQESMRSRYMPKKEVNLYAAITKKDTFEWIVEKATEIGVTNVIPILAMRSEKKSVNMERLKKIAIEASEQSCRGNVPNIQGVVTVEQACTMTNLADTVSSSNKYDVIVFHTEGDLLSRSDLGDNISIFIGPEGGWTEEELNLFHQYNMPIYSLGRQVLRAETAVIAGLSAVIL